MAYEEIILDPLPADEEAALFRERAFQYLLCFNDACPLSAHCMHWLVGRHADVCKTTVYAVNPRHPSVQDGKCPHFREKLRVTMKTGMRNFFVGMTGRQEHAIRARLIEIFNRRVYYAMRNGQRLITFEEQQTIADVCRQNGWTGPLTFDSEGADYLW